MSQRALGLCIRALRVAPSGGRRHLRILSHSTLLLQDGLHIEELPLVLKRATIADFTVHTDTNGGATAGCRLASNEDEAFRLRLRDCGSVLQVFRLLEVPGGRVSQYSAVFALQRLSELQRHAPVSGGGGATPAAHSFVRTAVLNELCDVATRDAGGLTADAVVSLVAGHLVAGDYDARHVDRINDEVALRIGDASFSIASLCALLRLHSEAVGADATLTAALWSQLATRAAEIDHTTLGAVYRTLRYAGPAQAALRRLCERRLQACWSRLSGADVGVVARTLALTPIGDATPAVGTATALARWLAVNVHAVTDGQLTDVLSAYARLSYGDPLVTAALERYVTTKVEHMDKTLVAMVIEHFRSRRYLSPRILDAVAADFRDNSHAYPTHAMVYTLRAFGELNYLPLSATGLFRAVEEALQRRLSDLEPPALLQLLASFVYIERFPVNFVSKVFSAPFIAKVLAISAGSVQQRAARNLMQLQAAIMIEFPRHLIGYVDRRSLGLSPAWLEGRHLKFHQNVGRTLQWLVGSDRVRENVIPRNTPHLIDFQLEVTSSGDCLNYNSRTHNGDTRKLALVGIMPEDVCVNTRHLLGEFAMRKRHLSKLGYQVIDIHYAEFSWTDSSRRSREQYLSTLLRPHMNLPSIL